MLGRRCNAVSKSTFIHVVGFEGEFVRSVLRCCNRVKTAYRILMAITLVQAVSVRTDAQVPLGTWTPVVNCNVIAVHMEMLYTGQVFIYDGFKATIWNPANNTFTPIPIPLHITFCGSNNLLFDGRVFMSGGGGGQPVDAITAALTIDPITKTYGYPSTMQIPRWYGTSLTLSSGDVLLAGGANALQPCELFHVSTNSFQSIRDLLGPGYFYPRLFVAPNGLVFNAGPDDETYFMDPTGNGSIYPVADNLFGYRQKGSAVMYDEGKVMIVGGAIVGTGPATNTCEIIDLNQPNPVWHYTDSMTYARKDMNLVLEPNGKVLAIGGVAGPAVGPAILPVEEWDPATGHWTILPPIGRMRGYHSTALLIPDGRIISAGATQSSYQVFTPGYLQKGPRPVITSAPAKAILGSTIDVATPDASKITNVNIVRMSTATHAINLDQRICKLSFSAGPGGLNVQIPSNPNVAVPGYYMLFILDGNGVPSVAKTIQVVPQEFASPSDLVVTVVSARTVHLRWTDNSSQETSYVVDRSTDGVNYTPVIVLGPNALGADDTTVAGNTTYSYRISAFNAVNDQVMSNVVTVKTPVLTIPLAPASLKAKSYSTGQITLSWVDSDGLEAHFLLERSTDNKTFTLVKTIDENVTNVVDTGLLSGKKYFYRMRASNGAGTSSASNTANAIVK